MLRKTAAVRSRMNSATNPSALTPPCQRSPAAARFSLRSVSRKTQASALPATTIRFAAASQTSPGASTAPRQLATSAAVLSR